jgi:[ribosomal protein S5]-alanine N-acetyltransferase
VIATEQDVKLFLRTVTEKDLDELYSLQSSIYNKGDYYPLLVESETSFKSRFRENGFWGDYYGKMLIVDDKNQILGDICYFMTAAYLDSLEIAAIIYKEECRHKGIMTKAMDIFVRLLFETKKVNRLQLTIFPGNIASKKIVEKYGFKHEGILRGAVFKGKRNIDVALYSLLRDEWESMYFDEKSI